MKKKLVADEKLAELMDLASKLYVKNSEGRIEFVKKLDPNRSFLVKKNTERIKSSVSDLMRSKSKIVSSKPLEMTLSYDEMDDIPF